MIVKGIVEQIISEYQVRVRIPMWNGVENYAGSTPTENLPIATVCSPAGIRQVLKPGEVVFVELENDEKDSPVVIGVLERENTTSTSEIQAQTLDIDLPKTFEDRFIEPISVKIDEVTKGVDSALSTESTNPVQNKVITSELNNKLSLSGGTMTGELITSFSGAVACGSKASNQNTLEDLINEVRYSSGCMGSVDITTAYDIIPTSWYNYIYIPHRTGGYNGHAQGDNCDYGTLLLFDMTSDQGMFRIRFSSNSIAKVEKLMTNNACLVSAPMSNNVVVGSTWNISVPSGYNALILEITIDTSLHTIFVPYDGTNSVARWVGGIWWSSNIAKEYIRACYSVSPTQVVLSASSRYGFNTAGTGSISSGEQSYTGLWAVFAISV